MAGARALRRPSRHYSYKVRERVRHRRELHREPEPLSRCRSSRCRSFKDWGEILHFLLTENLPGAYPYTGGVYPYRREEEDPTRMFAGEGAPERTNRRFHYLAGGHGAARLSTAFDSTTLYGEDPDTRPDIYGRTGNSGVSIATLDDMKKLYSGFDLCAADDLGVHDHQRSGADDPRDVHEHRHRPARRALPEGRRSAGRPREQRIAALHRAAQRAGVPPPSYKGELPPGHDGTGLGAARRHRRPAASSARSTSASSAEALQAVRGTVQADILKEDQAQNTCIFSTEFALRMMGDVQQYFIDQQVRNFYSVSISGYHIAEAGANPISQLAFTLANGFTIVEYYLARGMKIDDFAPNLSFFFSNGMDPEYAVIGRVARRIWARAMRELLRRRAAQPDAEVPHADLRAAACTRARSRSTTSAPRCRRCTRCSTTATACTPTPTTRR